MKALVIFMPCYLDDIFGIFISSFGVQVYDFLDQNFKSILSTYDGSQFWVLLWEIILPSLWNVKVE